METIKTRLEGIAWLRALDWYRGLRAGTAISAPLLVGAMLNQPEMAWAGLGGFEAIIADKGGPYRSRIASLGLLTVGGAAGCMLGTLVGGTLAYAIPVTILWCLAWSYLMVLGEPFASASPLIELIYVCGVGAPSSDVKLAATHAGFLLLGGLWSILLSLFLWPIDPYRPARFAISDCYRELAGFLASIHELNLRKQVRAAAWHRLAQHHQSRLRRTLERARHAVSSVRAESDAETLRGRNLIVLLESADMLLARSIALAEYMEMTATQDASPCTMRGKSALLLLEQAESWISEVLRGNVEKIDEEFHTYEARLRRIPVEMAHCMSADDLPGQFLLHQISDATENLETALESATAVRTGQEPHPRPRLRKKQAAVKLERTPLRLEQLAANFTTDSLLLRHAARVAVVCTVDVFILIWFNINHGYWMMLTSLIVLQPHVGGTFYRSLQRIGGTVAGGILAAVLAVFLHSEAAIAAALFPLGFFALAVLPVSYSLFCFFLTPTFVLAFLPYVGDWQLAGVRIINTILGALIAMLAMAVLWPTLERRRFGTQLQRSLQANRLYLERLLASWRQGDADGAESRSQAVAQARRGIGLAHNDSEDSLDRLRLEPTWTSHGGMRGGERATEAAIAFVTYLRRFGQSITTLASLPGEDNWKRSPEVQGRLERMSQGLTLLEHALEGEPVDWAQMPEASPLPEAAASTLQHNGQRQVVRMERQLAVLQRSLLAMERGGLLGRKSALPADSTVAEPTETR
ncbi:MAG TPA: FUSC family protein [Acidisarcina sp.]|nr:FUSC family protein [Acidisarcina sp.]